MSLMTTVPLIDPSLPVRELDLFLGRRGAVGPFTFTSNNSKATYAHTIVPETHFPDPQQCHVPL